MRKQIPVVLGIFLLFTTAAWVQRFGISNIAGAAVRVPRVGCETAAKSRASRPAETSRPSQDPVDIKSFLAAVEDGRKTDVEVLLSRGADPDWKKLFGLSNWTALMIAVAQGHTDIVVLLLAHGADVNAISKDGDSALGIAASLQRLDIIRLLLTEGADPGHKNSAGLTSLETAIVSRHQNVVRVLQDFGAPTRGKDTRTIAVAIKDRGEFDLLLAASSGDTARVRSLLRAGVNVNASDAYGITALMLASLGNHIETLRTLLAFGADVNARSETGLTGLKLASLRHHQAAIQILTSAGAR